MTQPGTIPCIFPIFPHILELPVFSLQAGVFHVCGALCYNCYISDLSDTSRDLTG